MSGRPFVIRLAALTLLTSACWLGRDYDECVTDADCPAGEACLANTLGHEIRRYCGVAVDSDGDVGSDVATDGPNRDTNDSDAADGDGDPALDGDAADVPDAGSTCRQAGQSCPDTTWSNTDFMCYGASATCLSRCDTRFEAVAPACADGSVCLALADIDAPRDVLGAADPLAPLRLAFRSRAVEVWLEPVAGPSQLDGACLPGDCNDSCFDPGLCPGTTPFTCDGGAGTCHAFTSGASFCLAAGDAAARQTCSPTTSDASHMCQPSLFCVDGICREPCVADVDCAAPETCVAVHDQTGDNRPGVCGRACDPYSEGQCGADAFCEPRAGRLTGTTTAWICDARVRPGEQALERGAACDPEPADGLDSECAEGLVCLRQLPADTVGSCVALCDPSARYPRGCAVGEPTLVDPIDGAVTVPYRELYGYTAIDAALGRNLELWEPTPGPPEDAFHDFVDPVELPAGAATTVIGYRAASGEIESMTFIDRTSATSSIEVGMAGLRAYNVSDVAWDVYRIDALTNAPLDTGEAGDFVSLALGDGGFNVHLFGTTSGYVFERVGTTPAANSSHELVIFERAGTTLPAGDEMLVPLLFDNELPAEVTTALSTAAAFRVINAAPLFSDKNGEISDDNGLDVSYPAPVPFNRTDIPYGAVDDWQIVPLQAGGEQLENISFGDSDIATELVALDDDAYLSRNVMPGDILTFLAWDDGGMDLNVTILQGLGSPATATEVAVRLSNASYDPQVDVGVEQQTALNSVELASLASLPATDGALDLEPGRLTLAVRTSTEGLTEEPTLLSPEWSTLVAGDVLRVVLSNVAAGADTDLWAEVETGVPDLGSLEPTETLIRLIDAADGAGGLRLLSRAPETCAPSGVAGVWRCAERCRPYLDDDYATAEGEPTDRWLVNECTHQPEAGLVFACLPFLTPGDASLPVEPIGPPELDGMCVPRPSPGASATFGEECAAGGDATCNPDAFCVDEAAGGAACVKLCRPFVGGAANDCAEPDQCRTVFATQTLGLCVPPDLSEAAIGATCAPSQEGLSCGLDDTFCLSIDDLVACRRVCKTGFGTEVLEAETVVGWINPTCPQPGEMCRTEIAFDTPAPPYLGACAPLP